MVLTIYDRADNPRAELAPNDSSTQAKAIQGDNVLTLSFTLYEHVELDVDDYVDFEGERYWLTEQYRPKQISTKQWSYDLKLYGIESLLRNLLVIKTVDNENDPVFTLTAPPREHVAMIVKCMNDGWGNITDWKVGQVDGTENIVIDYRGKYCDEALKEIAEKVGAEWWTEGQTVNVCRCEHGEPIALGYDNGLLSIDPGKADNVKFYTRLWPVGSSRNIDPEKYGYTRLQLPGGQRYVEVNADKYGRVDHYEADAFADIYPRRTGTVSSVRSEVRKGEDGKDFTIYYFRDNSLPFNPNDYEIGGLVKRVSFQEGSELAGLGEEEDGTYYFEVNYNADTREFEIITIWPYDNDMQLPGSSLVPKTGDRYILWNLRMPDEYYGLAEEEFLTAVNKYNTDNAIDISVFKAPTDHVWIEEHQADLFIGRRVRLESDKYFPGTGYRDSRITKITRKVNLPSQMDIEIGDALSRTSKAKMTDDISAARSYAQSIGASISLPDIIRTWDRTVPTDNNLFSARRSQREFISKNSPDRAKEKIAFEKGIEAGDYKAGAQGGTIDGDGNAELLSLLVRAMAGSARFVDGLAGEGWRVWLADGLSHLAVDELTVRRTMTVFELLIDKVRSVGGQICVSAANGKIKSVETDNTGNYLIEFEQENTFMPHDLMRCKRWGGGQADYWVEISAITDGRTVVAATEFGGHTPAQGDECVLMGNTEDARRQSLILISATEDGQPRIDVMDGVSGKSFAGCLRARLGNLDGISDATFGTGCQPHGYGLYSDNAYLRGVFLLDTGEDVKTRFEIVEGKVESSVESVRRDLSPQGYLANQDFSEGSTAWITGTGQRWLSAGGSWLMAQGRLLSQPGAAPAAITDGHLRLNNGSATQYNADMATRPDGETQTAVSIALSVETAGTLTVRLGSTEGKNITLTETLDATDGRVIQVATEGLWDGTGDFTISFTGNATVRQCVVSDDRAATLAWRYRTLFEQSDTLLRLSAENFDAEGNVLEGSAIEQSARNVSIEVKEEIDGALKRTGIDISSGEITATADRMKFTDSEGNTQALIEDGKLNIGAVEAGYVMVGDPQGESVEISPDTRSVVIRDTEGNVCQELSGRIGGGAPEDISSAIAISIAAGTESITPTGVKTMKILKERWRVDADAVLSAGSMTLGVTARVADIPVMKPGYESASGATATFATVRICRYGDSESTERLWSYTLADIYVAARADASGNRTATAEKTFTRPTLSIPAGWYEVQLEMTVTANHTSASGGSIAGGSATWGSIAGVLESNQYVSRYYGNGFTLGASSNNYASAWYGSDGMHFESRSGDSGLRMDADGVERYIGGQWTPIPALIFFGRWTWNASASTYTLNTGARTFAGVIPTLTRVNTGHVIVAIPQEWRTALGTKLTVDRMRVLVTSLDSLLKASVEGTLSTNAVQISMADSRTSGDGSFALSIEII